MKGDESSSAYLTRAQEYSDALTNIREPAKEKDLVKLVISVLRDEYSGLKSTLLARQFLTAFSKRNGLLADHDFMIKKIPTNVSSPQAFTAPSSSRTPTSAPTDTLHAIKKLAQQLGFQHQSFGNPLTP